MSSLDTEDFSTFMKGLDLSYHPIFEANGFVYKENGVERSVFLSAADNGVNYARIRIFHKEVKSGWPISNTKDVTLVLAQEAHDAGLKILLDFHYSDHFADPYTQTIPDEWASYNATQMEQAVYDWTHEIMTALSNQGTLPAVVQIGNETNSGMLWDIGKTTSGNWENYANFTQAGIDAVKAVHPGAKIMIHRAGNGGLSKHISFFDKLINTWDVTADVIAVSQYPDWNGDLGDIESVIDGLATEFDLPVVLVETAHPWTDPGSYNHDSLSNLTVALDGYSASLQGHRDAVTALMDTVAKAPGNNGVGLFYWPADVTHSPNGNNPRSRWEAHAYWDSNGELVDAIDVYQTPVTIGVGAGDPPVDPPSSPTALAHWKFEDAVDDEQGNVNSSAVGTLSYTDAVDGKGVVLDGSSWIDIDDNDLEGAWSERTIAMWIKPAGTDANQVLFEEGGRVNGFGLRLVNDTIEGAVAEGSTNDTVSVAFTDTGWTHVALRYDNGDLRLFLNGQPAGSVNQTGRGEIPNHSNAAGLGARNDDSAFDPGQDTSTGAYFSGIIDDARVYASGITDAEIEAIYDEFTPPSDPPTDPPADPITIGADDDAFVRGGSYSGDNYGSVDGLVVKADPSIDYDRASYIRFEFSSEYTESAVTDATLRLYIENVGSYSSRTVRLYETATSWSESSVTWDSGPAVIGSLVDSVTISSGAAESWVEFDVTTPVSNALSAGVVSFYLVNEGSEDPNSHVRFKSREDTSNQPELVISP